MDELTHSVPGRTLALVLAIGVATLGCEPRLHLGPTDGAPEYQLAGMIAVPGGTVNAAGGNLMIERLDMSIDTVLGTQEIRAIYNANSGDWLWNFQVTYDGASFLDATGAAHELSQIAEGAVIPGTVYVRGDSDTIETKGGLAFHFDASGALSHVAWKTADYPRLQYTRTPGLLEIEQCPAAPSCLLFYTITLNPAGDPLSVTDARTGRVADFQYDGLGRLIVARDALAVDEGWPGFQYEYSTGGSLLIAIMNSEGERIEYAYQGNRRIRDVTQIGEGNPLHRFGYTGKDAAGFYKTLHTNPLGALTRYIVDGQRRLHRVELADAGEATTLTWADKRPASLTVPSGVTSYFTYVDDDLASVAQPSGNVITYTYEPGAVSLDDPLARPLRRMEDSLGLIQERSYDPQGRIETATNGEGETVSLNHGPAALESFTNPAGLTWSFPFYGIHGHWLDVTGAATEKRAFDPTGNPTVTGAGNQEGGVLTRTYDGDRNLNSLAVAASAAGSVVSQDIVSISHRSDGRRAYVARPGGADHEFVYNAIGRLSELREKVDGVWQSTRYEYDAAGNLTAQARPNGMREEFDHDSYGRLLVHRALRDGVLEAQAAYTYALDRLKTIHDSTRDATEIYAYDLAGRLETIRFGFGETVTFVYDLRSRRTTEIYALPVQGPVRRIDSEYDLANRRTRITTGGGELLMEKVYTNGQLERTRYGNGLERDYAYDPVTGELIGTTTANGAGQTVEDTAVVRAARQNPARFAVEVDTVTPLAATREEYWLGLGGSLANPDQLVGQRVWHWTDGNGSARGFAYDGLSNPIDNASGDAFVHNAEANRLLSASLAAEGETITYTYDDAGFAASRNGTPITWTAAGRLASYDDIAIEWDMRGRPVSSTVAGVTREFVFFGGAVDSDPDTGALGALDLGVVVLPFEASGRLYRHRDFRGNVSFASDDGGAVVAHYQYSAYGVEAAFGPTADARTFAGGREIGELTILGARAYDPAVGRFLSPDPVFQLLNPYSYTLGNPVFYWDPDGAHQSVAAAELAHADAKEGVWEAAAGFSVAIAVAIGATAKAGPVGAAIGSVGVILTGKNLMNQLVELERARDALEAARGTPSGAEGVDAALSSLDGLPNFDGGPCGGNCGRPSKGDALPPSPSCAPIALAGLPNGREILGLLLVLNLFLGVVVLRGRARAGRRFHE
jgi:RHS repeat-associated protein